MPLEGMCVEGKKGNEIASRDLYRALRSCLPVTQSTIQNASRRMHKNFNA